jgi:Peptidase family C25
MRSLSAQLGLGLLLLLTACGFSASPASSSRYKLTVSAEGLYRVTASDLMTAGIDSEKIDPSTLQLFHGDREVAIRVQGTGRNFSSFEFYAPANDSPYSPNSVYWFQWGIAKGKRMQELALPNPTGVPKESFEDTIQVAKPSLYIPEPGDPGNSWFWQSLTAPTTATITVTLPALLSSPARARLDLWGGTTAPISPNHHITVFFNNVGVANEEWSGQGPHTIDATIPSTVIRSGANTVRLVSPGDTGAPADIVLLRSLEVSYARRFVVAADQEALKFEASSGAYRVEGFGDDSVDLYDITNAAEPIHAANVLVNGGVVAFTTNVNSARRWLAIGTSAVKSVAHIDPMTNANLKSTSRRADYIIITPAEFQDALKPLVQWREQHGLKVVVVTTDQVYDEFGFGAESPLAIRAFIAYSYHQWARPAPRFVLLVGKASYDYLDYLDGPNKNLLPTFLVTTPHLGQAASDNWFVAPDDSNGRPVLAIGRIPAKNSDEVTRAVDKTIAYESANPSAWRQRAIFVADDKEPSFAQSSDELAAQAKMQTKKVYLAAYGGNVDTARAEIVRDWNAGAGLIAYIGHGSIDTWAAGPLFSTDNLSEIKNGDLLPILLTPTCLDGFFYHPQVDSLAEDLLFKSDGGIVAGLVPSGLSLPGAQDVMMRNLFKELFGHPDTTLGEAIMRAKQETQGDSPDIREVIDTFGLLGDPALGFNFGD